MPAIVDIEKCDGCKSCQEVCPSEGISVPENVAVVNVDNCIDCAACVDACVNGAITMGD